MARKKRTSESINRAQARSSALESIDTNLDLGNSLTLAAYKELIAATEDKLSVYNIKLSEVDGLLNELEALEKRLEEMTSNMLGGVGLKYGKDSDQYEMAGGTRKSERKTAVRKAKTPETPA